MTATQFHVVSFEGPDVYARAGGIATRISGLCEALAELGFETHLWFVGDPDLPGHEQHGQLHLHRWCQWISRYHPHGVYDGQEGKRDDCSRSLAPRMLEVMLSRLGNGGRAVVLAEEWQTVGAVMHLDHLLREAGLRHRVPILWNANNTFGFDRIDWRALERASTITTVSRYMNHCMQGLGVDPLVIPNGLSAETLQPAHVDHAAGELRHHLDGRTVLAKVARFDPDKRWMLAIETVAELKKAGWRPLLVARGGLEAHGADVMGAAAAAGLRVRDRDIDVPGAGGLAQAMRDIGEIDVVNIRSQLDWPARYLLYQESAAVLANSSHEPFGLVGLETMAVGGIACTGCSGEDYAVPGHNALVMQTADPQEFVALFEQLHASPYEERAMREAGRDTARQYEWSAVVRRALLPRVRMAERARPN